MYDIIFPVVIAIFGIAFTLFTLFFSFIFTKREELRNISSIIKSGNATTEIKQREKFAVRHIRRLKLFNMHIIILLFSSFVVSIGIFLCRNLYCEILDKICAILTIALTLYLLSLLCFIIVYYRKSTKI